jgi:DNA-directed RNA polymerase specialized sigma54-like protein
MALDKEKIMERFKSLSPEDKTLFREAIQETDPEGFLSLEEVSTIREMLAKSKKKKKGVLDEIDSFFGFGKE